MRFPSLLSNEDIEQIARACRIPQAGWRMRDEVYPRALNKLLVINQAPAKSTEGTHWVGLIEQKNMILYFDSYGLPSPTEVVAYGNSCNKPVWYNDEIMQSTTSELCGWFCLYWAWLILVERHPNSIIEPEFINETSVRQFKRIVNGS